MKVVEIFTSIEGEGLRAGLPCTFIRLFGCNLQCSFCDTVYGWQKEYENETTEMSIDEIATAVDEFGLKAVTITGGEPLIHTELPFLLKRLVDMGCEVNVETNGSIIPPFNHVNVFYTMDFKTNASGMSDRMNKNAFLRLSGRDVIKFVVGSIDDCKQAKDFLLEYWKEHMEDHPQVFFSPVFGSIEAKDIVQFILDNKELHNCKVQLQLHKYIWDVNQRGV